MLRVVRIVRRLNSLRTITNSLKNALLPLFNAFCLLALIWGLYAVAAVQLYSPISMSSGLKYFDKFSVAAGTLFQVAAGDTSAALDTSCSKKQWSSRRLCPE